MPILFLLSSILVLSFFLTWRTRHYYYFILRTSVWIYMPVYHLGFHKRSRITRKDVPRDLLWSSVFLNCESHLKHLRDAGASALGLPGRQSKIEVIHEVREAKTNWNLQVWANTSVSHHLQDSGEGDLQKKLVPFVMKLNTHLAQEKENPQEPQELGPDIKGFTERSAYQCKCCSSVVVSTSSECSEDLPFDFCVLKF